MNRDINILALEKGGERYIFWYDDASRCEALRTLGQFASNPELSFTWYDAAKLSQEIRKSVDAHQKPPRFNLPVTVCAGCGCSECQCECRGK